MKKVSFLLLLISAFHPQAQTNRFKSANYKSDEGSLNYRLLVPDALKGRKLPLVIFLHGSGERGSDNEAQLKWGVQQFATDDNIKHYPAFVVAPQCPKSDQWASYDGKMKQNPTKAMSLVREMIDELLEKYAIDKNRIYITGLSMGGYGTFDALARYPDLFAAGVPVCGSGDPNTVDRFKDIPIWIYTGAEDPVVPAKRTVKMFNALLKTGASPGYTQVPEVGHFSWIQAYSDPLIMQWMFRQRRD